VNAHITFLVFSWDVIMNGQRAQQKLGKYFRRCPGQIMKPWQRYSNEMQGARLHGELFVGHH
jgi:hypothetical protein